MRFKRFSPGANCGRAYELCSEVVISSSFFSESKGQRPAYQRPTFVQNVRSGPEGLRCKVPGLMPRLPFPDLHRARNFEPRCVPELPCGSDFGSRCCTDGPACFGTDERGAALSCREGFCLSCGVSGTPPCAGTSGQGFPYSLQCSLLNGAELNKTELIWIDLEQNSTHKIDLLHQ
jgi:hypothetical protein